ncbi:MAG: hypothetical protein SGJ21_15315 [Alphaproteobacteria bacterium]|nr:hypothetical protein [Alphaproteobacteria bacterium]
MLPPRRKPFFSDSTGTGAEITAPHTADEMGWLVDNLAGDARWFPDWRLEGRAAQDIPVRLEVIEHDGGRLTRIRAATVLGEAEIVAAPDPSGWVLITARAGGAEVFRAFMDHPYEEYELWPSGSRAPQHAEPPGRMGKKRTWISLSATLWPELSRLAPGGHFNASVVE